MLDIEGVRDAIPLTLKDFILHVKLENETAVKHLETNWIPECCMVLREQQDSIEEWVKSDNMVSKYRPFCIILYIDIYINLHSNADAVSLDVFV